MITAGDKMSPKCGQRTPTLQLEMERLKKKKRRKEGRKINGRNDVDFGQEKGQSLGIHVV